MPEGCVLVNGVNVEVTLEKTKQSNKTQEENQSGSQIKEDENAQNKQNE